LKQPLFTPPDTPASKCFVCGPDNPRGLHLQFHQQDGDRITAEIDPPEEWIGWDGLMHGGFQCLLLDEVTAWTVTGLLGREYCMTTTLEVRFRKPVRLGQKLTLVGQIIKTTHSGSRVRGELLSQDGQLLAEAEARIVHAGEQRFKRILETAP